MKSKFSFSTFFKLGVYLIPKKVDSSNNKLRRHLDYKTR